MKLPIIWDVETLAQPAEKILASLPEWSQEEALTRLPKTHKLKATVDAWLENDAKTYGQDVLDKAALNPEHATIAVVGVLHGDNLMQMYVGREGGGDPILDEETLVRRALSALSDGEFCAWNQAFDLRMIIQRAWLLGVSVPRSIYNPLARYPIPERFVCLMEKWGVNRGASYSKLQNVAKALGLEGKTGDGKDFGKLWAEDPVKALEYNAQDLKLTQAVAARMGVL